MILKSWGLVFCFVFIFVFQMPGQSWKNENYNYLETIKSVQFTIPGLQTSYPIVPIPGGQLRLTFDEIGTEPRYLRYKIEHCNQDWSPSELEELEYLRGFNDEELRDYAFSVNTRIPYVHYWLSLPNKEVQWTRSGNYLLHIYDEDSNEPILTRRFMVVEPIMRVSTRLDKPVEVSRIRTHHELDFTLNHKNIPISNPYQEVSAVVMQNGRWDNAIVGIKPYLIKTDELLFDYQDKIIFPAGKEFRNIDFRSLKYPSRNILEIQEYDDAYEVKLELDEKRTFHNYHTEKDFNGSFVIESHDDPDNAVESEYAYVLFTLASSKPLDDQDVYVVGGFSNWLHEPAFKMDYQERYSAYMVEVLLKQGVYDYAYSVSDSPDAGVELSALEGDWHETENYYTILVYYRPFGERYDRLVAVTTYGEK
jgi:hypothetical protein